MIGFIGTSVTISLNYYQYSAIADLHTFQFTVTHALGFSVSTSRLLATALNSGYAFTMSSLSVYYQRILTQERSLQITMKSSSTQFSLSNLLYDWNLLVLILKPTELPVILEPRYIAMARTTQKIPLLLLE
jgi:hypothetical protein